MSDDYARNPAPPSQALKWLLIGFVLCFVCIGAGAMWLLQRQKVAKTAASTPLQQPSQKPALAQHQHKTQTKAKTKTHFAFYQTLTQKKTPNTTHHKTTAKAHYAIQIASLRHFNEADQLKAMLLLQGFPAHINKVKVKRHTWHRVVVGPYAQRRDAERVKNKLAKNHRKIMIFKQST